MADGPRRLVVVRPEPGNARTVAAARALGLPAEAMPLFRVAPLAWIPPDPSGLDALVLTSANAVRHGGAGLAALRGVPVVAVGAATATAARAAGLRVALTGDGDGASLVAAAAARGYRGLLHLAGRERADLGIPSVAVYASDAAPAPPGASARLAGATVLLHSPRAARAVATLASDRRQVALAAISPATLAAAGAGWRSGSAAPVPTDEALLALVRALAD